MKKKTTAILVMLLAGCGNSGDPAIGSGDGLNEPSGLELPVVTNAQSPVAYPPDLFEQGVEGTVVLRLFVDEAGNVNLDSVAVVESSGNGRLDTAAVEGVALMQFAPGRQDGIPIATTFLQPIHFRNPETASGN